MAKKKIDIEAIAMATEDNPYWLMTGVCTFNGLVYEVVFQSYFPHADPVTFRKVGGWRDGVYADKTHVYQLITRLPENMDMEQFCYQSVEFQNQHRGYEIVEGINGGSLKKIGGVDSDLFQDKNGYYWNRTKLKPADDLDEVQEYLQLLKAKM